MPLTIKDVRVGGRAEAKPVPRNIASLFGGIVIAVGCLVLWLLVAMQITQGAPTVAVTLGGVAFAVIVGVWIRLADM